ncbi:eCIS core domain-containing protein [Methylomonas rhizoryzae]|uniref:eCIS core domain-containing protein n=1 Tax=Methylomonas rhizoryzae TaxID=2608981 RepID=UPI001232D826|nr:DUF4157 domain-containing protein [Methylomonas rhizoryzae]
MATLASTLRKKKARRKSSPPPSAGEEKKQRKPAYLKRKMAVSQPSDPEEKEADKVAKEVSRAGKSGGEEEAKEDKKMISSKPVPSAQRLMRRVNRAAAQQNEEKQQEPAAKRVRRSVETEDKEEQPVQRLFRKGKEDMEQAARRLRRAAQPAQAEQETKPAAAAKLRRSADKAGEEQQEVKAQARLFRAEAEAEEQQAAETGAGGQDGVEQEIEQRIENTRGKGDPLPEAVRKDMEQQFGQDFSAVVIHNDAEAAELCKNLNARAFTVGDDIYFAPGEFAPETESGRDLLAHELTHTLQQGMQVSRKIYRADKGKTATSTGKAAPAPDTPPDPNKYDGPEGIFEKGSSEHKLKLKGVDLPSLKKPFTSFPVTVRRSSDERSGKQAQIWDNNVRDGAGLNKALTAKKSKAWKFEQGSEPVYFFSIKKTGVRLVGTETKVRDRVLRPYWTPKGEMMPFHVDHKLEYQLGGEDENIDNLWLLDASSNTSSGSLIAHEIERCVNLLVSKTPDVMWTESKRPDYETLKANHEIKIIDGKFDKKVNGPEKTYTKKQIADDAIQMEPVEPMSLQQVKNAGLEPKPSNFVIYNNASGGRSFSAKIPAGAEPAAVPFTDRKFIPGFRPTTIALTPEEQVVARIRGSLFSANPGLFGHGIEIEIPVNRMEGLPQAGYANFSAMRQTVIELFGASNIELKGMSPLKVVDVQTDDLGGVTVRAQVLTDIQMIRKANIEVAITSDEVSLQKSFSSGELSLPGPVKITGSSLTIALSTKRGLAVEGQANLAIDKVGTGYIGAEASKGAKGGASFAVAGRFNFDPNLFDDPSFVAIAYRDDRFSGEGQLTVGQGRVRGVKSGSLHVNFNGDEFAVTGTVDPDIPGVEQATIAVRRTEAEGLIYEGDLQLSSNPAIRSGSIHAKLQQVDDGWKVSATGSAQPAIPGVDSELTVSYDDGAFTAEFSGAYKRGMLTAQVTVGASNRAIGEDGKPSGEPLPDGALNVYGSGSATIKIAPWLQGTAGIRFDPNGEVTVSGEIGIPNNVEIFARKELEKSLFSASVKVPIVPGIVAEVGGGLSAKAGIGPGVIDQLRLGIEYNPAHEENTHVTGDAHLKVPADAGLRLSARAGIGVGITGVSVTGGLEIGGTLGIEGAAEAGVHIDWTPATGLDLTANLSIHAQPNFTFDVSGYVEVEALFFTVYENRWQLASYQFGSGYQFGISLPIHYHEGQPFDISLDDVQFQVPDISVSDVVYGLIERIV